MSATGLCECGCGQPTPLARETRAERGHIKGEPVRFRRGHGGGHRRRQLAEPDARANAAGLAAAHYAEHLAHLAALVVGAVHDEDPAVTLARIRVALALPAPDGIDPAVALITVLAAQVDPDTTTSARLGWVETFAVPRSPAPTRAGQPSRERGAA